ncbi:MAG: DUF1232 domain-containing protein [Acidobacteriota bacterium]
MVPRAPAELADDGLPSTGLLSFYDRLREGIIRTVERRGGKLGQRATDALLLVPDIFMLLVRLSLDKDVPKATRGVLASTLAYFVLPFDLLPEGVIGPVGYLDDLALALMALSQAFGRDLEVYAERHWSGSQSLRQVMSDALTTAHSLLGSSLFDRLQSVLAKRGVELEEPLQDG